MSSSERRLAAIMFSDIVGYTALMAESETRAIAARDRHRGVLGERATAYHGEVVDENGDELVLCFASAVDAVNCALAIQAEGLGEAVELRIGIHLGDVVFEDGRVYGDGVNLASRVRPFAEPGGLCVSEEVAHAIHNQPNVEIESIGAPPLKNVDRPVELYAVTGDALPPAGHASGERKRRARSVAALFAAAGIAACLGLVWWVVPRPTELQEKKTLPLSDRPSIAVLPFANVGNKSEEDYFADGVTEDIIATLGRFSNLVVMAWNAVRPYKATPDVSLEVSRDLNVRYLVDGSIRRSPDRVRVSVQLTEAATGVLLWSDRFDRSIDDIFVVQDEIVQGIVGSLAAEVGALEDQRALAKPTDSLSAYDYFLRGRRHLRGLTRPANLAAREMFEKAIEIDPEFAAAYAGLGWTHNYDAAYGWHTEPDRA
ncbi:MAG: adenylate cyclase, partial [Myxococcales bacterium]|nr:adenylate cyclase [Myxococcales bacterium]